MRSTGIVRKVDEFGRVVLPMELRRTMDIQEGQPMEIFTDADGKIVLRKYEPDCLFCHSADNLMTFSEVVESLRIINIRFIRSEVGNV